MPAINTTVISNVRVFDGYQQTAATTVIIHGSQIGSDTDSINNHHEMIDGSGCTLLPGLIDTHIHLDGLRSLELSRDWGVTTLLDMGSWPPAAVDALRNLPGLPDIRSSYAPASAPGSRQTTIMGFPVETVINSVDQVDHWLATRIAEGADYIKIIVEDPADMGAAALDLERISAIVKAARARGLKTIAHATSTPAIQLAVAGDVDVITHAPLDKPLDDATIARMVERAIVSSPTLIMMQGANTAAACGCLPKMGHTEYAHARDSVTLQHKAGVLILAGTDANTAPLSPARIAHGSAMHKELALLVEAGLTPTEALRAATSSAAKYFGLDDRGIIAVGKRADLLLVDGDPTSDIAATKNIRQVWCAGIAHIPVH